MSIWYNKVRTHIHLDRIRGNYRLLKSRAGNPIPVIKADAYGHGLIPIAADLVNEGVSTFCVGTVEEAGVLRSAFPHVRILSLLGPLDEQDYQMVWEDSIVPMVFDLEQLKKLDEKGESGKVLDVALKFDTGMSRLGFTPEQASGAARALQSTKNLRPVMACSHLACADEPDCGEFVNEQGRIFQEICDTLRKSGLEFEGCLANSAAILAYPHLHHQAQRPGISLYGTNPFLGTPMEERGSGLQSAMEVTAPVIAVHDLPKGRSISYGRTFTAEKDMRVAILAAGYADNYSRGLSNRGMVLAQGKRVPILGRVCMQLLAVDITNIPPVKPNDPVYLLGGGGDEAITPHDLASWWGTITYEVFCLLGQNRKRYIE